jgi:hypothetical protein
MFSKKPILTMVERISPAASPIRLCKNMLHLNLEAEGEE